MIAYKINLFFLQTGKVIITIKEDAFIFSNHIPVFYKYISSSKSIDICSW